MKKVPLIVVLVALVASASLAQAEERRVALVIGNGQYQFNNTLKNPVNDATDIAASLQRKGFTVTILTDAGRAAMEKAVRDFGAALKSSDAVGLFYYSGHGAQTEGQTYLLPVNADIQDVDELRYKAVDVESVLAKMRSAGNKLNIVVLDACRNNPFPGSSRAAEKGLSVVKVKVPESVIVYATDPGATAEDGTGRNSPFTTAFLASMEEPGLDITIMMKRVTSRVQVATGGTQTPWVSTNLTRDFVFKTTSGQNAAPLAAPESAPSAGQLTAVGSAPAESPSGVILVSAETGGKVFVDGVAYGEMAEHSTGTIRGVRAGSRSVEVRYLDGRSERKDVVVLEQETVSVSFTYRSKNALPILDQPSSMKEAKSADALQPRRLPLPDGSKTAHFGSSLALSDDYLLIGAPSYDSNALGEVFFYRRTTDGSWRQVQKVVSPDGEIGDGFGGSVSIFKDYAVVGARTKNRGLLRKEVGAAYLFHKSSGGIWQQCGTLLSCSSVRDTHDFFGSEVAVSSNYVAVADAKDYHDPAIHVFQKIDANTWGNGMELVSPNGRSSSPSSLAISDQHLFVGYMYEKGKKNGIVHVYRRLSGNSWTLASSLRAPSPMDEDHFGFTIALDGTTLIVAAANGAYVYSDIESGRWVPEAFLSTGAPVMGQLVSQVAVKGGYVATGVAGESRILLFARSSAGAWAKVSEIFPPTQEKHTGFGQTICIGEREVIYGNPGEDTSVMDGGAVYSSSLNSGLALQASLQRETSGGEGGDDKAAAMVRLIRKETISVRQLRKQIDPLEAQVKRPLSLDERKLVLDGLVAKSLIEQAAERDKVYASDAEVNARLDQMKKTTAQSLGLARDLTDADLRQMVAGSGVNWDEYLKNMKYQVLLANYARAKKKSMLDVVKPPTDEELKAYYDANKKSFFIDGYVKIRHIFVDTRAIPAKGDQDKAARRADDVVKSLRGGASFDELVLKYSDDGASKYRQGDFGYITRVDEQRRQLLGKDFIDAVLRLEKGETSSVLQSSIGYHIVRVDERFDAKLLGFDEKVPPAMQYTVKDFIRQNLAAQAASTALTKALEEIVKDLRKQAEVKITEENLAW